MVNKIITKVLPYMPERLVWIFSKRYVAGKTLAEAVTACKELNTQGINVTIDILGEFIKNIGEAEQNMLEYLEVIETIQKNNIRGNYSLKPTMFGLLLDKDVCYSYIRRIVAKAAEYNNFVRIDMEDSPCTSLEIELFRKIKAEFPRNAGLVFQAYLKRTLNDISCLLDLNTPEIPLNFRLCKGIYNEPKEIAYKNYDEINENYLKILEFMFVNKVYVGIATHDKYLIDEAYRQINKHNVSDKMFEFQMLHGVTPELRNSVVKKGYLMRVYVPYGTKWFAYCVRRLKENPKMAGMILKAIFRKG